MIRKIQLTSDGSHTVLNEALGVTYHSVHGAVEESMHVFIKNGLARVIESGAKEVKILEIGLGTGLNALLTVYYAAEKSVAVKYDALEPFPLQTEIIHKLNYPDPQKHLPQLHSARQDVWNEIKNGFEFRCHFRKLEAFETDTRYDLIYFDAFAYEIQPELWSAGAFSKIFAMMEKGACLVTYAAKGVVKRTLRQCGFEIEALPGPPHKREMIRAFRA